MLLSGVLFVGVVSTAMQAHDTGCEQRAVKKGSSAGFHGDLHGCGSA